MMPALSPQNPQARIVCGAGTGPKLSALLPASMPGATAFRSEVRS
jgi:hypothetical protein